ncbi:hypothetical protein K1T71_010100 [Dendrolimus kikuchii]|uniref:Uncharacterized protein n=1 Tax=Dendrolimus kikuchii TaxID=765133 RepID=A0ACC1CQN8_9NEOP|nr:hypothetical protein K1T71_010100 [Dendrolimus kikuchii]
MEPWNPRYHKYIDRIVSMKSTKVDNTELKAIVEADPSQTMAKIAAGCGVSDKTVLIHLKQIGKVNKLESDDVLGDFSGSSGTFIQAVVFQMIYSVIVNKIK